MNKKRLFIAAGFLSAATAAFAVVFSGSLFLKPAVWLGGAAGPAESVSYKNVASVAQPLARPAVSANYKMSAGFIPQTLATAAAGRTSKQVVFNPAADLTVTLDPPSGTITVEIPAGSFAETLTLTIEVPPSFADAVSDIASLRGSPIGVEITNNRNLQPRKPVTLRFAYRDADISGMDENRLRVAFYDETRRRWVPLNSTIDIANNRISVTVTHFTVFRVVEMVPALNVHNAFVYPNPLRPSVGYTSMNITNLPADTDVKIFTLSGELVAELLADATGRAVWDGRNKEGQDVASGVYLALVRYGSSKKTVKIAVER